MCVCTVPLKDNITFVRILLTSELIYLIEQHDYNLVNSSVLHSTLDVYRVYILYSLKLSRTKIFVNFVVFEAPTKILSSKISYKLARPIQLIYIVCASR